MDILEEVCKQDEPGLMPTETDWIPALGFIQKYRSIKVMNHVAPKVAKYLRRNWSDIFLDPDLARPVVAQLKPGRWPVVVLKNDKSLIDKCYLSDIFSRESLEIIDHLTIPITARMSDPAVYTMIGYNHPEMASAFAATSDSPLTHQLLQYVINGAILGKHLEIIPELLCVSIGMENNNGYLPNDGLWAAMARSANADVINCVLSTYAACGGVAAARMAGMAIYTDAMYNVDNLDSALVILTHCGSALSAIDIPFQALAQDWERAKAWLHTCPDVDDGRVMLVDTLVRMGAMGRHTTPLITMSNINTLMHDALQYGYSPMVKALVDMGHIPHPYHHQYSMIMRRNLYLLRVCIEHSILHDDDIIEVCNQKNKVKKDKAEWGKLMMATIIDKGHTISDLCPLLLVSTMPGYAEIKKYVDHTEFLYLNFFWSLGVTRTRRDGLFRVRETAVRRYMQRRHLPVN